MRQPARPPFLAAFTFASLSALSCAGSIDEGGQSSDQPSASNGTPKGFNPAAPNAAGNSAGNITGPGGSGTGATVVDPVTGKPVPVDPKAPEPILPGKVVPGPMPLLRLTRSQYANAVAELFRFNSASMPALDLPVDPRADHGFAVATPVGEVDTTRLQDAADAIAAAATKNLSTLLPCDPAKGEKECASKFIESFGRRAFRRALTTSEVTDLVALYDMGRGGLGFDFAGAIAQVIRGLMQAPQFIYRWELGPKPAKVAGQVVALTADEIASRLSFFLWGSMPDDALFMAADTGKLATPVDVAREARRMLADPKSRATIDAFHRQWLHLKEDPSTDLAKAMDGETTKFAQSVFEKGGGLLDKLLLSPTSFVNKALADIYEVKGVTGTALTEQMLDAEKRFGVFTQPSFLTATAAGSQSHPMRRGKLVYEQLLCGGLPPQPANVPPPPALKPNQSNRERFTTIAENPCATACHGLLNPFGFAFENYDGVGKYRTQDGGKNIDASGMITLDEKPVSFNNAKTLMSALAASPTVRDCIATQWSRFALSRAEMPTEGAALASARDAFKRAQFDLRELLVAVTQTPSFLNRTPAAMEVLAQ